MKSVSNIVHGCKDVLGGIGRIFTTDEVDEEPETNQNDFIDMEKERIRLERNHRTQNTNN